MTSQENLQTTSAPIRVGVPNKLDGDAGRVAATPDTIKKLIALGAEVFVEPGAGQQAGILDSDFETAGATQFRSRKGGRRLAFQGGVFYE